MRKKGQLVKRLRAIKEAKEQFGDRWVREIFFMLLKQSKWTKVKRDEIEGDVVLRKDKMAAIQKIYKHAPVIKIHKEVTGK